MSDILLAHEPALRLAFFITILLAMVIWEMAAPRRRLKIPRLIRWSNNLGIVIIDTLLVRMTFPIAAVGLAVHWDQRGWGLLNLFPIPEWLAIILAILVLDFTIYLQHVLFHAVPVLWRLHRMHHADLDFDVTTGLRFHPVEILLSMAIKLAIVAVLGPPAVAVLIFEILLNATSMFNHANIRLPPGADRALRRIIVTPDMHRIHHSVILSESNTNFGFSLSWWDRLLGTYRADPAGGHEQMAIGINQFRSREDLRIDQMLLQPFRNETRPKP